MRSLGIVCALLFGLGLPGFMLGPVLFEGASPSAIPTWALPASVAFGVFGAWLLVVSLFAHIEDVEKVLEPFQAAEAVVLFLPYMLLHGTRSVWRAMSSSK